MTHIAILRSISPVSSEEEVFNEDDAVDFFKVQSENEQVCTFVLHAYFIPIEIKLASRS